MDLRLGCPVRAVTRERTRVWVTAGATVEAFDDELSLPVIQGKRSRY